MHYIREHEKNLRLQFSHLDKNRDGKSDQILMKYFMAENNLLNCSYIIEIVCFCFSFLRKS